MKWQTVQSDPASRQIQWSTSSYHQAMGKYISEWDQARPGSDFRWSALFLGVLFLEIVWGAIRLETCAHFCFPQQCVCWSQSCVFFFKGHWQERNPFCNRHSYRPPQNTTFGNVRKCEEEATRPLFGAFCLTAYHRSIPRYVAHVGNGFCFLMEKSCSNVHCVRDRHQHYDSIYMVSHRQFGVQITTVSGCTAAVSSLLTVDRADGTGHRVRAFRRRVNCHRESWSQLTFTAWRFPDPKQEKRHSKCKLPKLFHTRRLLGWIGDLTVRQCVESDCSITCFKAQMANALKHENRCILDASYRDLCMSQSCRNFANVELWDVVVKLCTALPEDEWKWMEVAVSSRCVVSMI